VIVPPLLRRELSARAVLACHLTRHLSVSTPYPVGLQLAQTSAVWTLFVSKKRAGEGIAGAGSCSNVRTPRRWSSPHAGSTARARHVECTSSRHRSAGAPGRTRRRARPVAPAAQESRRARRPNPDPSRPGLPPGEAIARRPHGSHGSSARTAGPYSPDCHSALSSEHTGRDRDGRPDRRHAGTSLPGGDEGGWVTTVRESSAMAGMTRRAVSRGMLNPIARHAPTSCHTASASRSEPGSRSGRPRPPCRAARAPADLCLLDVPSTWPCASRRAGMCDDHRRGRAHVRGMSRHRDPFSGTLSCETNKVHTGRSLGELQADRVRSRYRKVTVRWQARDCTRHLSSSTKQRWTITGP